ncbi:AAA family ATPase [Rhizobium sp. PP-CC-3G-465]|uniref:AAA family ATPase n=1 Tax=Rhizobium sp. PP-CC-3G-465 TaxID=2135648 RepID=UPI0010D2F22A|nr:peptidase M41-like protein [Rhizobium sp. PP-CC-3G-465]
MLENAASRRHVAWDGAEAPGKPKVTVPTFLAYMGVAAALRHYARNGSGLVAILRVDDTDALDVYADAVRLYFHQPNAAYSTHDRVEVTILKVPRKDRAFERHALLNSLEEERSVILCTIETEIDEEIRLEVDIETTIARPRASQVAAMFKRFRHPGSKSDIETILSADWKMLRVAFRSSRPVAAGLRRLRANPRGAAPGLHMPKLASSGATLDELHGLGDAAAWGKGLARDLRDLKAGRIAWEDVDSGVLVSGPPGTGKTLFAEALARTCGVPIVVASAARWQAQGYLNDFLKAMRSSFDEAKALAPAILFVDEADSFGDRGVADHNADYKRQAINGFLELLDGFERREGVVVVGATNHPEAIDPAIRRSGRLDRNVEIALPDASARVGIFRYHIGMELGREHEDRLARSTEGMSGADIARLARDARRVLRRRSTPVDIGDVLDQLVPLVPLPADILRNASVHEAGHAVVGLEVGIGKLVSVGIAGDVVAGTLNSLGQAVFEVPELHVRKAQHYLDTIAMLLAGMAAETVVFGTFSNGATGGVRSDLAQATEIATLVEGCYGMGETLVVENIAEKELARLRERNPRLRAAVGRLMSSQLERAVAIVKSHQGALEEIAQELLEVRHMSGAAVEAAVARNRRERRGVSLLKRQ